MIYTEDIRITRAWSMPNKYTFRMAPVADLLSKYVRGVVVDPFAGDNKDFATVTNDVNHLFSTDYHLDAVEFMDELIKHEEQCDVLLIDPPYSPRQMKECYSRPGLGGMSCSTAYLMGQIRERAPKLVKPGGLALCFGWNSNGMGHPFGIVEVRLVAHGASHNDTICTVERL